jgi:subtilisin family serine protease
MKWQIWISALMAVIALSLGAAAQTRYILRPVTPGGLDAVVQKHQLTPVERVDAGGNVWVVTADDSRPPSEVEKEVQRDDAEVTSFEADQVTSTPEVSQSTAAILDHLPIPSTSPYYGNNVLGAYMTQPAATLIRLADTQTTFQTLGSGTVAIIDTGIDPGHPVLVNSIVPGGGYDFVRNRPGASEWGDLTPAVSIILNSSSPVVTSKDTVARVSQSTAAILDQSTAAILDWYLLQHHLQMPAAFGHGTMVAGVVHLVAPGAQIMPLKAFRGDGTANLSDILRAIYYATDHGAHVINMSFTLTAPSTELANAIGYADSNHVICVAAAGNHSKVKVGNPANLPYVMGVASTSNKDLRSTFTSFGKGVFVAAPGEGIVTTFPGQNYAEATGTSFSAPLVAGAAALTVQVKPTIDSSESSAAVANAKKITSTGVGHGRLDLYQAIQAMQAASAVTSE